MNIDFPLILVLAVFGTGLVWLVDALFFAGERRRRRSRLAEQAREAGGVAAADAVPVPGIVDFSRSIFPVLLLVLVLRSFLVEPFQLPSGSMLPTLQVGDFILVNKFSYGIRLPVLGTKVKEMDDPKRGDVVVFRFPQDPSINYIKRVVGIPGDRVRYENKALSVNGRPYPLKLLAELPPANPEYQLLEETTGKRTHKIFRSLAESGMNQEWVVPEDHYFVMGDNRDHSNDSRYWGTVADEYLVGRAFAIWVHWKSLLSFPSFKRNGTIE